MKKLLPFLAIIFTLSTGTLQAQAVVNSGFEHLNSDGSIRNWGNVYLFNGTDSVVWDGQFCASTNDAVGGTKAMELRNGWNYTSNKGIAGSAGADEDSVFSSWSLFSLVSTHSTPFSPFVPFNFGFYFKYFPVNGDSAFAQISLWDSSGNQLAEGMAVITGTVNTYTQIIAPIDYIASGDVAYYNMSFSTFFSLTPGSHEPGFGTRLIVDDITFNNVSITAGIKPVQGSELALYPNPAQNEMHVITDADKEMEFYVYNVFGQIVLQGVLSSQRSTISLENISNGLYTIELISTRKTIRQNFIVNK